nr:MAG TPA: hypothetical protein [Caudoviricetes sp.]
MCASIVPRLVIPNNTIFVPFRSYLCTRDVLFWYYFEKEV